MKNNTNRNHIKLQVGILATILILLISVGSVVAANYVKVATFGTLPTRIRDSISQKTVDRAIRFWERQLEHVKYDKPDLIVLPEHAGIPRGTYGEERKQYLSVRKDQILDFFKSVAKEQSCYIALGMLRKDSQGHMRNSLILLNREGKIAGIYDKNYPTIGEMQKGIKPGTRAPVFKCDFGTVG